jgi:hypothetical protein
MLKPDEEVGVQVWYRKSSWTIDRIRGDDAHQGPVTAAKLWELDTTLTSFGSGMAEKAYTWWIGRPTDKNSMHDWRSERRARNVGSKFQV